MKGVLSKNKIVKVYDTIKTYFKDKTFTSEELYPLLCKYYTRSQVSRTLLMLEKLGLIEVVFVYHKKKTYRLADD